MHPRIMIIAAALAAGTPLLARAQDHGAGGAPPRVVAGAGTLAGPFVHAGRRDGDIVLDGRLDETAWQTVTPATGFVQTEPVEGAPASEPTEVYMLFDQDALYVAARLVDRGGVSSRLGRRDAWLSDSDWFTVLLDSHHDHLTAYEFAVNPAGVKRDQLLSAGRGDESWDAVWDVATERSGDGWTVELRIPFSQVRFPRHEEQVWGIQLVRRISRLQEVSVLAFTPRSQRGGVAAYGHLLGLEGMRQARRFELLPYAVARVERAPAAAGDPFHDGSERFAGMGLDVKYRLTSALTLDATLNPDFGQVELDPAVVNLTAYETSFDEKRPFFVEGSEILQFAGQSRGLYYSRRIGRAPQGALPDEAVHADRPATSTILGAAKLTGRTASGWSIGALGAITAAERADWVDEDGAFGRTEVEPATRYGVARVQRSLRHGQTTVGAMATGVHRDLEDAALAERLRATALTGGLDFTHEFLDRKWSVEGSLAGSFVEGSPDAMARTQLASSRYWQRPDAGHLELDSGRTSLAGYAARLEVGRRAGLHWRGEASLTATSPGYEINDLGFQNTVDRVTAGANVGYLENAPVTRLRSWRAWLSGRSGWNYGRDLVDLNTSLRLEAQLLNYWSGSLNLSRSFDSFSDRLTRGGPLTRDPGGYGLWASASSDGRSPVSARVHANLSWSDAGGWSRGTSFSLSLRPAENWSLNVGPRLERSLGAAQYLGSVQDSLMGATFGRRYLFSSIRQTTVSMETRLNLNVTPELSLDLYAQPFISAGDYGSPRQLRRPRSYAFEQFGRDVGTVTPTEGGGALVDPDGAGPAPAFELGNRDFTSVSLRGNAVLRWEWRAGSTLFLVWQQARSQYLERGDFDLGGGLEHMALASPSDAFVLKVNYWLNL